MLAGAGMMGDEVVDSLAAVTTGNDERRAQFFTERLQCEDAECSQILYCLERWFVGNAVAACRCTFGELLEFEVRGELNVVHLL